MREKLKTVEGDLLLELQYYKPDPTDIDALTHFRSAASTHARLDALTHYGTTLGRGTILNKNKTLFALRRMFLAQASGRQIFRYSEDVQGMVG